MPDLAELLTLNSADIKLLGVISATYATGGVLMDIDHDDLDGATENDREAQYDQLDKDVAERQTQINRIMKVSQDQEDRERADREARETIQKQKRNPRSAPPKGEGTPPAADQPTHYGYPAPEQYDGKPSPITYALGQLDGDLANLSERPQNNLLIPATDVDLRALNISATFTNANLQEPPVTLEGDDPIHLTDFVPTRSTSITGLQWNETTAHPANASPRKQVGTTAADATPVTDPQSIIITRLPIYMDVDNRLMNAGLGTVEYVESEMNSQYGILSSAEMTNGDGADPNQRGIRQRERVESIDFSRGTGNIYANFITAVAEAQGKRIEKGYSGGTVTIHPVFFYKMLDYREQGRPVFNEDDWPLRKYGLVWRPTLGWEDATANDEIAGCVMNFGRGSVNWIQRLNLRMLDQIRALEGQTRFLLEVYNMYQWKYGYDMKTLKAVA